MDYAVTRKPQRAFREGSPATHQPAAMVQSHDPLSHSLCLAALTTQLAAGCRERAHAGTCRASGTTPATSSLLGVVPLKTRPTHLRLDFKAGTERSKGTAHSLGRQQGEHAIQHTQPHKVTVPILTR